jgi:hypothetical protein
VRHFLSPDRAAALAGRIVLPPDQPVAYLFGAMLIRREARARVVERGAIDDTMSFFSAARGLLAFGELGRIVLERRVHGENHTLKARERVHAEYLRAARAAIVARRSGGAE